MVSALCSLLIIICGVLAFFRPIIGIVFLVILECTFILPTDLAMVNLGVAGIAASKIILAAVVIRTIASNKIRVSADFDAKLLFALLLWIGLSSCLAFLVGQSTKQDLISVIFQTTIYYVLVLAIMTLSPAERRTLANLSICIAVAIALTHLYVKWTKNVDFIARYYYLSEEIHGKWSIAQNIGSAQGKYFIPRGSAFVMIATAFLATRLLLKSYRNILGLCFLALSLAITLVCSITFAQRSFILIMPLIGLLYIFISFKKQGARAAIFAMIVLFCVGLGTMNIVISKTDFADVLVRRTSQALKAGSLDPSGARKVANTDALRYVAASPVWGIGSIGTGGQEYNRSSISQNAHALLRVGLMGGVPAMILIVVWLASLFLRFFKLLKGAIDSGKALGLSAFGAVLCGTLMMMLNTVPILIYSFNVIPFSIFVGLFLSECKEARRDKNLSLQKA